MGVDNGALARRYMTEIWAKGNIAAIDELVSDDIVLRDPMTPNSVTGKAEVRKRIEMMPEMFADSTFTINDVLVTGDRVAICSTWTGVHKGDFFNIKPTGKTIRCEACDVLRLANGKVVENVSYFDVYEMFQQMGALPPPNELKAKDEPAKAKPPETRA